MGTVVVDVNDERERCRWKRRGRRLCFRSCPRRRRAQWRCCRRRYTLHKQHTTETQPADTPANTDAQHLNQRTQCVVNARPITPRGSKFASTTSPIPAMLPTPPALPQATLPNSVFGAQPTETTATTIAATTNPTPLPLVPC